MSRTLFLDQTCNVTKNPSAGSTGVAAVVTGLACTAPFPVQMGNMQVIVNATTYDMMNIIADYNEAVAPGQLLAWGAREFTIKRVAPWHSRQGSFLSIFMEDKA